MGSEEPAPSAASAAAFEAAKAKEQREAQKLGYNPYKVGRRSFAAAVGPKARNDWPLRALAAQRGCTHFL